jgi:hypothetical protein
MTEGPGRARVSRTQREHGMMTAGTTGTAMAVVPRLPRAAHSLVDVAAS